MKYRESGFRSVYKQFCAFEVNDALRDALKGFPNEEEAEYALLYGYIDREAGMTLEVLASGIQEDGQFRFAEPGLNVRSFVRVAAVMDQEYYELHDDDSALLYKYAPKLDALTAYEAEPDIERSRAMTFLDPSRDHSFPDDVLVYLVKGDMEAERVWVRLSGLAERHLAGVLLSEPEQDYGVHEGDALDVYVQPGDDGEDMILFADLDPDAPLTPEELEDGTVLKRAIDILQLDATEDRIMDVVDILAVSEVFVPFTDAELTVPEVLQDGEGGAFYLPAFSDTEELQEFGPHDFFARKPFREVIEFARYHVAEPRGIVVNPFGTPFFVPRDLYDVLEQKGN